MNYRRALITGGTSGIGAAFARNLPRTTNLLLVARHEDALAAMQTELASPGRDVTILPADLTTEEGRKTVIEAGERLEIDLLVNNAGVGQFGPVLEHDPDFELKTVELNVVAPTVLTRALLPGMLDRARTRGARCGLILVSSNTAFQPVPYLATYCATKSFLLAYGEALAEELRGKPCDLLVLCPTATRTHFGERAGFRLNSLPGAESPDAVARGALAALGQQTVHVRGAVQRMALMPLLMSRRLTTGGLAGLIAAADRVAGLRTASRPVPHEATTRPHEDKPPAKQKGSRVR